VLRILVDRLGRADLDDAAEIHDRDPVAEELRRREVVGDVQVREIEVPLEREHQLQDLRPDAHVEHRYGFVGDEQDGVEDDRPGDHRPLFLTAGQIGGVLVEELVRRRKADDLEHLGHTSARLVLVVDEPVDLQRMGDGLADRHRRVERRVRVLEHDLHAPPVLAQLPLAQLRDVPTFEDDAARGGANEPEQRAPERGLTAPRLADQPEHLARPEVERHIVDRPHGPRLAADQPVGEAAADRVEGLQVAD
jgi:hypothetical protein